MSGLQQNSTEIHDAASITAPTSTAGTLARVVKLFGLYVLIALVGHLLEDAVQLTNLMPSEERGDPPIAGIVFVSIVTFVWTLLGSAVALTLNARMLFPQTTARALSAGRSVQLIALETIRAISTSLVRLPLLLVPGIFEWIRLTPIPFLVLFDPAYQKGEVDALEAARLFFKTHWLRVLLFMLLSVALFALEFATTESPSDVLPLWQAPFQHAGSILVFSLLRLGCDAFTLHAYASQFPKLTGLRSSSSDQA